MGGAVAAVESGYLKARWWPRTPAPREVESGEQVVVGVNGFTETEPNPLTAARAAVHVVDPGVEERPCAARRVAGTARRRGGDGALDGLRSAARPART